MNSPEQDLLQSLSDAQANRGGAKLRLVAAKRRPEIYVSILRSRALRFPCHLMSGEEAAYVALGARTFQEMKPCGTGETGLVHCMVGTGWQICLYEWLLERAVNPEHSAMCARRLKRSRRMHKEQAAVLEGMQQKRMRSRKAKAEPEPSEAYEWYAMMVALTGRLVAAREELEEKSTLRANGTLRLVEPLSPESIEVIAEAYRNALLAPTERTLFASLKTKYSQEA